MSLVAAYSSDSETGDENENKKTIETEANSNTEEESMESPHATLNDSTEPTVEEFIDIVDEDNWQTEKMSETPASTNITIFSLLPQPKDKRDDIFQEDLDDEFIKKKPTPDKSDFPMKPKRDNIFQLPAPSKGKRKEPVKITVPSLNDLGNDSDSDNDDGERTQKVSPSLKKSSLFAILPKPRHSVTVGNNQNRVFQKESNRTFMPHTLTKKMEPISASIKTNDKIKIHDDGDGEDEEEDIGIDNFFSLSKENTDETLPRTLANKAAKETCFKSVVKSIGESSPVTCVADTRLTNLTPTSVVETEATQKVPKGNAYFSSLFKSSPNTESKSNSTTTSLTTSESTSTKSMLNLSNSVTKVSDSVAESYKPPGVFTRISKEIYSDVTAPYASNLSSEVMPPYQVADIHQSSTQPFFSYAYSNTEAGETQSNTTNQDYYNQPNEDPPLDESALVALQGRKRRREEVNIIDVNADDIHRDQSAQLKNLTVETSYSSKKSQKDQPNRQQKAKHQITYLAFQAKERELELRQQWAENRATKQQTQSRYGF